jgi:hypothetical protein
MESGKGKGSAKDGSKMIEMGLDTDERSVFKKRSMDRLISPENEDGDDGKKEQEVYVESTLESSLNVISGVIRDQDKGNFIRILYRTSHGKIYTFFQSMGSEIGEPLLNEFGAA